MTIRAFRMLHKCEWTRASLTAIMSVYLKPKRGKFKPKRR